MIWLRRLRNLARWFVVVCAWLRWIRRGCRVRPGWFWGRPELWMLFWDECWPLGESNWWSLVWYWWSAFSIGCLSVTKSFILRCKGFHRALWSGEIVLAEDNEKFKLIYLSWLRKRGTRLFKCRTRWIFARLYNLLNIVRQPSLCNLTSQSYLKLVSESNGDL